LWEAEVTPQLRVISSVSGGSWFSTQYAFSQAFFDAVNMRAPRDVYREWLTKYYQILEPLKKQKTELLQMELQGMQSLLKVLDSLGLSKEVQLLSTAVVSSFSWEVFVGMMIDAYHPQLSNSSAEVPPGHLDVDLLVCTAISQGSILARNSYTRVTVDEVTPPETFIPAAWHVPAKSSQGSQATWWSPKYKISSMQVHEPCPLCVLRRRRRSPLSTGLATPTVGQAAAMSSAAAGILGTTSLLGDAAAKRDLRLTGEALQLTMNRINLQGMGVCAGPLPNDRPRGCDYPSVRLIDGGYADNSGIATVIAKLQNELGIAVTLKVVALDSNQLSGTKEESQQLSGWGGLFSGPASTNLYGAQDHPISNQIFSESLEAADIPGTDLNHSSLGAHQNFTLSHGTYTTVANTLYGVKAGQKVEMLGLHINSVLSTILLDEGDTVTNKYTELAQATYEVMANNKIIETFFGGTTLGITGSSPLFDDLVPTLTAFDDLVPTLTAHTCQEIKEAYENQQCCSNSSKIFAFPNQRRTALVPTLTAHTCQEIKEAYKDQQCCSDSSKIFAFPNRRRTEINADKEKSTNIVRRIATVHKLHEQGLLSEQEYQRSKMRILEQYLHA